MFVGASRVKCLENMDAIRMFSTIENNSAVGLRYTVPWEENNRNDGLENGKNGLISRCGEGRRLFVCMSTLEVVCSSLLATNTQIGDLHNLLGH